MIRAPDRYSKKKRREGAEKPTDEGRKHVNGDIG